MEPGSGATDGSRKDWSHISAQAAAHQQSCSSPFRLSPASDRCDRAPMTRSLSSGQAPARPVCDPSCTHPPPPVAAIDQRPLGLDGLTTGLEGRPGLSGCSHSPDVCLVPNVPSGAQVRPGEPGTRGINRCQESLTPGYPIISRPNIKNLKLPSFVAGLPVGLPGQFSAVEAVASNQQVAPESVAALEDGRCRRTNSFTPFLPGTNKGTDNDNGNKDNNNEGNGNKDKFSKSPRCQPSILVSS